MRMTDLLLFPLQTFTVILMYRWILRTMIRKPRKRMKLFLGFLVYSVFILYCWEKRTTANKGECL